MPQPTPDSNSAAAEVNAFSPPETKSAKASDRQIELMRELMRSIWGDRIDSLGMVGTPERVVRHWITSTAGLYQDPLEPLKTTFPCENKNLVIVKDIPFSSNCEHHILPFFGVAHVGYIPNGSVVGISKIPRALDILARRPQLQETLTDELSKAIRTAVQPEGVAVVMRAQHTCMTERGVQKIGAETVTSSMLGSFYRDPALRSEFMELIKVTR